MGKFKFAIIGGAVGFSIWALSMTTTFCVFGVFTDYVVWLADSGDFLKADELILLGLLVFFGLLLDFIVDYNTYRTEARVREAKRLMLSSATNTIRDSVLNTYNGFQLVLLEAREKGVSEGLLREVEKKIESSRREIEALAGLDEVHERETSGGHGYLDVNRTG